MTDNAAHALALLRDNTYVVLATADGEGNPWATPVWFDSTVVPHQGAAFYATAAARQVPDEDLDKGLRIFNHRSLAQGLGEFARQDLTGQARLRLYVAAFIETWVLDQDADVDQRAPVPR